MEIAHSPALRREAEAAFPVLRAAVFQKAGETGVRHVLGKAFALYPQPERSDGEWAAWWEAYFDVLADVSWAALEAGMAAWKRDPASEFMPKPGQLLSLCWREPNRAVKAYSRVKRALEYQPPKTYDELHPVEPPKVRTMPTAAEIADVKRMAADFQERAKPPAPIVPENLPSIAGKPDEKGITPALRALIEKQRAEEKGA